MHGPCMATKTISLRLEAYWRLRRARLRPNESFSDVVMRARWPDEPTTAGEYLSLVRERGPIYDVASLDRIEALDASGRPTAYKWSRE